MVVLVDAFWNAPSIFWHLLTTFRRQRKLPPGFTEPLGPDKMQILEIMIPQGSPYAKGVNQGFKKETITLYWDLSGQHTVTWKTEVTCLVNGQSTTLKLSKPVHVPSRDMEDATAQRQEGLVLHCERGLRGNQSGL